MDLRTVPFSFPVTSLLLRVYTSAVFSVLTRGLAILLAFQISGSWLFKYSVVCFVNSSLIYFKLLLFPFFYFLWIYFIAFPTILLKISFTCRDGEGRERVGGNAGERETPAACRRCLAPGWVPEEVRVCLISLP